MAGKKGSPNPADMEELRQIHARLTTDIGLLLALSVICAWDEREARRLDGVVTDLLAGKEKLGRIIAGRM